MILHTLTHMRTEPPGGVLNDTRISQPAPETGATITLALQTPRRRQRPDPSLDPGHAAGRELLPRLNTGCLAPDLLA